MHGSEGSDACHWIKLGNVSGFGWPIASCLPHDWVHRPVRAFLFSLNKEVSKNGQPWPSFQFRINRIAPGERRRRVGPFGAENLLAPFPVPPGPEIPTRTSHFSDIEPKIYR